MSTRTSLNASCHCGAVRFEVREAPTSVTRCNCTFCTKRGVLWAYYTPDEFTLLQGREGGPYPGGEHPVKHYHCERCACSTYSDAPVWVDGEADPTLRKVGVNAQLFDDFDLAAVPVTHVDGRNQW